MIGAEAYVSTELSCYRPPPQNARLRDGGIDCGLSTLTRILCMYAVIHIHIFLEVAHFRTHMGTYSSLSLPRARWELWKMEEWLKV